jgi:hypothetical protein
MAMATMEVRIIISISLITFKDLKIPAVSLVHIRPGLKHRGFGFHFGHFSLELARPRPILHVPDLPQGLP